MKYYVETSLVNFPAWAGGADTLRELLTDELEIVEGLIEEMGDEMLDTEINDFLWLDKDYIAGYLGFEDFGDGEWESLVEAHKRKMDVEEFNDWKREEQEEEED